MNVLTKETLEEYNKKRLKELLEEGERPTIIASFIDYFGDGEIALCSDCATPLLVRPWILKAIDQHDLQVICICCIDTQTLKGQLVMDLAKIEEAEKK